LGRTVFLARHGEPVQLEALLELEDLVQEARGFRIQGLVVRIQRSSVVGAETEKVNAAREPPNPKPSNPKPRRREKDVGGGGDRGARVECGSAGGTSGAASSLASQL